MPRTLSSALAAELNGVINADFRLLLELTPPNSTTSYLSTHDITDYGQTWVGSILSLGDIEVRPSGASDVRVKVVDTPTNRAAVQMAAVARLLIAQAETPAPNLDDADVVLFGEVSDPINQGGGTITFDIVSYGLGRYDREITRTLDTADYPGATRDEIGKVLTIAIGAVQRHPTVPIDAGAVSPLSGSLTKTSAQLQVAEPDDFPASGTVQVDIEQMSYTSKSGNILQNLTRGVNGTVAAEHAAGANVLEVQTTFKWLIADHRMGTIDGVFVDNVGEASTTDSIAGAGPSATDTTIEIANADDFPPKGMVLLDNKEWVWYESITQGGTDTLNDCTRGQNGTAAQSHFALLSAVAVRYQIDTEDLSVHQLANGFGTPTDWTQGDGWSISAGVASCDGTQTAASLLIIEVELDEYERSRQYAIEFTVSAYTAGNVQAYYGVSTTALVAATGDYQYFVTADVTAQSDGRVVVGFQADVNFNGSINACVFARPVTTLQFPVAPTVETLVDLQVVDTIAVNDTIAVSDTIDGTITAEKVTTQNTTTTVPLSFSLGPTNSGNTTQNFSFADPSGTINTQNVTVQYSTIFTISAQNNGDTVQIGIKRSGGSRVVIMERFVSSGLVQFFETDSAFLEGDSNTIVMDIDINTTANHTLDVRVVNMIRQTFTVGAFTKTGSASKTGAATKAGTVALTGSVGAHLIGRTITVTGEGAQDDTAGTWTGTGGALIERPDHVARYMLGEYGNVPVAEMADADFDDFTGESLVISLTREMRVRQAVRELERQCRAFVFYAGDKWYMAKRPDNAETIMQQTPTIGYDFFQGDDETFRKEDGSSTLSLGVTGMRGMANRIEYRSFFRPTSGSYLHSGVRKNANSIKHYGIRDQRLDLPWHKVEANAQAVADWYLNRLTNPQRKRITLSTSMRRYEALPGDGIWFQSTKLKDPASIDLELGLEVVGIKYSFTGRNHGRVDLALEEAYRPYNYHTTIWGVPIFGTPTVLFPAATVTTAQLTAYKPGSAANSVEYVGSATESDDLQMRWHDLTPDASEVKSLSAATSFTHAHGGSTADDHITLVYFHTLASAVEYGVTYGASTDTINLESAYTGDVTVLSINTSHQYYRDGKLSQNISPSGTGLVFSGLHARDIVHTMVVASPVGAPTGGGVTVGTIWSRVGDFIGLPTWELGYSGDETPNRALRIYWLDWTQ